VQQAVLEQDCAGRDLRVSSTTGSGKTVALGLVFAEDLMKIADGGPSAPPVDPPGPPAADPLVDPPGGRAGPGPRALVITPTRELANQVRDELDWLYRDVRGLEVQAVTGGTSVMQERRNLARDPMVLVGTPGRLVDHMGSGALCLHRLRHVILDEADQMLDLGFRDELDTIVAALPESRSAHLVSATFPRQVARLADSFQRDALRVEGSTPGEANPDIEHIVHVVHADQRYGAIVNTLLLCPEARCLLFVRRRRDASEVAEMLASDGFAALPLSGELPQAQRTRTLNAFRNGTIAVLVATDVAARGIDVPDVPLVIHGDLPEDGECLTHRSGRTGRAGRSGRSILLSPPGAVRRVQWLLESAKVEAKWGPVPTPHQIRRAAARELRRELHERLDSQSPPPAQLEYAQRLLEQRDAAQVVATLLEQAQPRLSREPFDVTPLRARFDERREERRDERQARKPQRKPPAGRRPPKPKPKPKPPPKRGQRGPRPVAGRA